MAATSPTQRTLKYLRDEYDWEVCIVERWIQRAMKRVDAFGFGDLLAYDGDAVYLVQTTSGAHHADHKKKILNEPKALGWLKSGGHILLITWRKLKVKRGGKAVRWTPRIEYINREDFDGDGEDDHEQAPSTSDERVP